MVLNWLRKQLIKILGVDVALLEMKCNEAIEMAEDAESTAHTSENIMNEVQRQIALGAQSISEQVNAVLADSPSNAILGAKITEALKERDELEERLSELEFQFGKIKFPISALRQVVQAKKEMDDWGMRIQMVNARLKAIETATEILEKELKK